MDESEDEGVDGDLDAESWVGLSACGLGEFWDALGAWGWITITWEHSTTCKAKFINPDKQHP